MYKACPTEKCNKSVVDLGTGNYRCEKCAQEFANFHWRYILRGAIADSTDYQVNHRGGFRLEPIKNSFFIRLQHFAFLSGSKQNEKGVVVLWSRLQVVYWTFRVYSPAQYLQVL